MSTPGRPGVGQTLAEFVEEKLVPYGFRRYDVTESPNRVPEGVICVECLGAVGVNCSCASRP